MADQAQLRVLDTDNGNMDSAQSPRVVDSAKFSRSDYTGAAVRVFAITELLEHVLIFRPFQDVLLAQRVDKQFQQTIQSSLKLRKKLHLEPDHQASFSVLPISPACCTVEPWARHVGLHVTVTLSLIDDHQGRRQSWRNMFVAQPPIKTLEWSQRTSTLKGIWGANGGGCTLGAAVDAAEETVSTALREEEPFWGSPDNDHAANLLLEADNGGNYFALTD